MCFSITHSTQIHFLRSQYHRYFLVIDSFLTYYWLNVIFHYDNELMIYSYSHITENLSVF